MSDNDYGAHLTRLTASQDEAATVLRGHGETHWLFWLERRRTELTAKDSPAMERLLGGFGGMGSFNDLVIMSANGHRIRESQERAVNERLSDLREQIWTSATALRDDPRNAEQP